MMLATPPFGECNVQCSLLGALPRSFQPDSATSSMLVVQVSNSQIPNHNLTCIPFSPLFTLRPLLASKKRAPIAKTRNFPRLCTYFYFWHCVFLFFFFFWPNIDLDKGLSTLPMLCTVASLQMSSANSIQLLFQKSIISTCLLTLRKEEEHFLRSKFP